MLHQLKAQPKESLDFFWSQQLVLQEFGGNSPQHSLRRMRIRRFYNLQAMQACVGQEAITPRDFLQQVNCRPVGFHIAKLLLRSCGDRLLCPWCFLRRRFFPVQFALSWFDVAMLDYTLLCWTEPLVDVPPPRWFYSRNSRDVHARHGAWYTAQSVVYDYLPQYGFPGLRRVVFQVLPATAGRTVNPKLLPFGESFRANSTERKTREELLTRLYSVHWSTLYDKEFVPYHLNYRERLAGIRLLRTSVHGDYRALLKERFDEYDPASETEEA